jgi:hypothetical protein
MLSETHSVPLVHCCNISLALLAMETYSPQGKKIKKTEIA